jgi:acyl-CoA synthetase (AMP-forming)/AMP-acid ligase II
LKKGDCVALFMENKPEYVGVWLGLSKLGVVTALINTNLKHDSLLHCINVANASIVVYAANLEECKRERTREAFRVLSLSLSI